MDSLFITGYGGYIGRNLLAQIDSERYCKIYCLSRQPHPLTSRLATAAKSTIIQADIFDTSSYAKYLTSDTTVLHLAASTGKHTPSTHFRINRDGTHALLDVCRQTGVSRFIHVSTIAVNYSDMRGYHYAISKREAELAVQASRLPHTIIRPSMVIGPNSPNWLGLARLARLPIMPIFGPGTNLIQPIYIDDLVRYLYLIVSQHICSNDIIEMGGPEQITLKAFVENVRSQYFKKRQHRVHIPILPLRFLLALFEPVLYRLLPITRGQLSALTNDSTVKSNPLHNYIKTTMIDVSAMIERITHYQSSKCTSDNSLEHECRVFTSYLVKRTPSTYIQEKYTIAHERSSALREPYPTLADQWLVTTALRGRWFAQLIDIYTRLFLPYTLIRKKWILLLAILESSPDTHDEYDTLCQSSRVRIIGEVLVRAFITVFLLAVSCVTILPIHIILLVRHHSKFRSF